MLQALKILNRAARWTFVLSLIGLIVSSYKERELPTVNQIDSMLYAQPIQQSIRRDKFTFHYRGTEYVVEPVAEYELVGLVVSHNDITAFGDIYHDENSVDVKDLCIVWGSNLRHNAYLNMKYYNESVSCHFQAVTPEHGLIFNPRELSNNHLISDLEEVRAKIRDIKIGDQVRLKGLLVNYYPSNSPDYIRKTSLTRNDERGGACEVIFLEELEFIKKADRFWFNVYSTAGNIFKLSLAAVVILFLFLPWFEYKYG